MTLKETIEANILTMLGNILPGNTVTIEGQQYTYQTDAGTNVYEGLEYTEHTEDTAHLALFRGELTSRISGDEGVPLGFEHHHYGLNIEGMILDDKRGTEGEKLRRDLVQTVKSDDFCQYFLGRAVTDLKSKSTIQIGEEVFSQVSVSFTCVFRTLYGAE